MTRAQINETRQIGKIQRGEQIGLDKLLNANNMSLRSTGALEDFVVPIVWIEIVNNLRDDGFA